MSQDTEWFQGKAEDNVPELSTIMPFLFWLAVVLSIIGLLAGCATEPKEDSKSARIEVCVVQLLGQTDSGLPVVKQGCVTPEAFAEAQK
jgi:hypothetical protein